MRKRPIAGRYLVRLSWLFLSPSHRNVRLYGLRYRIQPVLNFACLLANSIQRTRVVRRLCLHIAVIWPCVESRLLLVIPEIVSGGTSDLSHVHGLGVRHATVVWRRILRGLLTSSRRQYSEYLETDSEGETRQHRGKQCRQYLKVVS